MNILHDIEPGTSEVINVIIEIPKGSKNKYEIDKKTGLIALDRVMHTAQDVPFDYGFIPQTLCGDGDPLDVVLLTTYPLYPGILVRVRPVAVLELNDSGEEDDKIIAVPADDPRWSDIQDLKDINKHTLKEIEHYYSTYKKIQKKEVITKEYGDKKKAVEVFEKSLKMYAETKK